VSIVCCQVEVFATSWSLVQRSPTDCGVSCVFWKPRKSSWMRRRARSTGGYRAKRKKNRIIRTILNF